MKIRQREVDGSARTEVQVARVDTKGKILSIEDTTNYDMDRLYEKVVLSCTSYADNKQSVSMRHFVDRDDLMLIAADIIANRGIEANGKMIYRGFEFTEYKGSKSTDYQTGYESRVLSIKFDLTMGHGAGAYVVTFKAGPGTASDTGAVMPVKGAETKDLSIVVSVAAMRTLMSSVDTYFRAKEAAFIVREFGKLYPKRATE